MGVWGGRVGDVKIGSAQRLVSFLRFHPNRFLHVVKTLLGKWKKMGEWTDNIMTNRYKSSCALDCQSKGRNERVSHHRTGGKGSSGAMACMFYFTLAHKRPRPFFSPPPPFPPSNYSLLSPLPQMIRHFF